MFVFKNNYYCLQSNAFFLKLIHNNLSLFPQLKTILHFYYNENGKIHFANNNYFIT